MDDDRFVPRTMPKGITSTDGARTSCRPLLPGDSVTLRCAFWWQVPKALNRFGHAGVLLDGAVVSQGGRSTTTGLARRSSILPSSTALRRLRRRDHASDRFCVGATGLSAARRCDNEIRSPTARPARQRDVRLHVVTADSLTEVRGPFSPLEPEDRKPLEMKKERTLPPRAARAPVPTRFLDGVRRKPERSGRGGTSGTTSTHQATCDTTVQDTIRVPGRDSRRPRTGPASLKTCASTRARPRLRWVASPDYVRRTPVGTNPDPGLCFRSTRTTGRSSGPTWSPRCSS